MSDQKDIHYMKEALSLADKAAFNCPPNPAVGCVIVKDDHVIGKGFTQKTGSAHAEVMALRDAQSKGNSVEGATVYVTLEPCSHWGRTPPCALALKEAKVKRVVAALTDPNPLVSGRGIGILQDAGIQTSVGVCEKDALERNIGFIKRMQTGLPFVRTKIAMSLDGKTALENGKSRWITGPDARQDGMLYRARSGAILTGAGTVRDDDPLLNVRVEGVWRQPLKVVVDSKLSLDPSMQFFTTGKVLAVCSDALPDRVKLFEDHGVEVLSLPGTAGSVDLKALIEELGKREINEVHVEAGAVLNGALTEENLIDEYLFYIAPKILGPGRPALAMPPLTELVGAVALDFVEWNMVGKDLRLVARPSKEKR